MTEVVDQTQTPATNFTETDLVAAVRRVLQASDEPLTLSKIRASLPTAYRGVSLEALEETLNRQVSANVLHQFPKYRSQQHRYWDRPMRDHIVQLLVVTLEERPLALSELRRKLPDYAKTQAEDVLHEEVNKGRLHRHPSLSSRSGPRYGANRPDPKEYLRAELSAAFGRLEQMGFRQGELREGAMELLQEEEWNVPPQPAQPGAARPEQAAPQAHQTPAAQSEAPAQPTQHHPHHQPMQLGHEHQS